MNSPDQDGKPQRHRTAIRRYKLSKPLQAALSCGLLKPSFSVFDFGCGHGEDVSILRRKGIQATGWDPHFRPDTERRTADVVNLGYVLNVIEDVEERRATLMEAHRLASKLLIVAVRVDHALASGTPLSDGVLTGHGSFQKIYTQQEFKTYVHEVLASRPYVAELGVLYLFKDPTLEAEFLASRAVRTPVQWLEDVLAAFRKDRIAQRFIRAAQALGRLPLPEEFPSFAKLTERFGPSHRVAKIAEALLSAGEVAAVRSAKREDLLLYFGMLRLEGLRPPPFRALASTLQADIKMLWATYQAALEDGDKFLFQMGNSELVRESVRATAVGKALPDALYVHRSCSDRLPPLLRLVLFGATQVIGDVEHDVVKIASDGRQVSFLKYRDFDADPHPSLEYSFRVHLPTASHTFHDYRDHANPPILHRKDAFVDPLYPSYPEFRSLTEQEEKAGLLSRSDIGFRRQWTALLSESRLLIEGHKLRRVET